MTMQRVFRLVTIGILVTTVLAGSVRAERDLRVFGYFQNAFQYDRPEHEAKSSTFLLQHLNMLFQKEMSASWSTYINIEFTNSFSSTESWGAANIQEAWALYRFDNRFNLKLGLQTPTFNNLNEIKNRTPLLPYIIRPVVYESSLEDVVSIDFDQYVPNRAFVQAYGFLPLGKAKFDYAFYLGNSPNINSDPSQGQTGVDTTDTFLGGARFGIRYGELKAGVSTTYDKSNFLFELAEQVGGGNQAGREIGRVRLGGDLSYRWKRFSYESEYIAVIYDDKGADVDLDMRFFYLMLGYDISDRVLAYAGYQQTNEDVYFRFDQPGIIMSTLEADESLRLQIPYFGLACRINDRITGKIQTAPVRIDFDDPEEMFKSRELFVAAAISAWF
jgi:hypothetical protein